MGEVPNVDEAPDTGKDAVSTRIHISVDQIYAGLIPQPGTGAAIGSIVYVPGDQAAACLKQAWTSPTLPSIDGASEGNMTAALRATPQGEAPTKEVNVATRDGFTPLHDAVRRLRTRMNNIE